MELYSDLEKSELQYVMVFAWLCYRWSRHNCVFQFSEINWPSIYIMVLAIINGFIRSIILETIILACLLDIRTAFSMSLMFMLSMEIAMNLVDIWLTGGAKLTPWVVPVMLIAGFIKPLPYNYWRLKKWGLDCCGKVAICIAVKIPSAPSNIIWFVWCSD